MDYSEPNKNKHKIYKYTDENGRVFYVDENGNIVKDVRQRLPNINQRRETQKKGIRLKDAHLKGLLSHVCPTKSVLPKENAVRRNS